MSEARRFSVVNTDNRPRKKSGGKKMKINGIKVKMETLGGNLIVIILPTPKNDEEAEKIKNLFNHLQGRSGGSTVDCLNYYEAQYFDKKRTLVFTLDSWRYSVPIYNDVRYKGGKKNDY